MNKNHPSGSGLNTLNVGPLTMAQAMVSKLVARTRDTIQVARHISAMVESVERLDDRFEVSAAPQVLNGEPLVCLSVGKDQVAMQSVVSVEQTGRSVLITLKLNAYLLDRAANTRFGPLVSSMAGHFNTQVRINLRDTFVAEDSQVPEPTRRLRRAVCLQENTR